MTRQPVARLPPRQTQGGFLLPQLAVVVLIGSIAMAYVGTRYWQETVNQMRDDNAKAVGVRLATINDATKTYATTFFTQIQRGQSVSRNGYTLGPARLLAPTLADLSGLGFLPARAANPLVYSGQSIGFNVRMTVDTQSGCTIPTCNLLFQVTTTAPLWRPGTSSVDVQRATLAANTASPGNAGVSIPASMGGDPSVFVGNGGTQVGSNPGGVAGLISMTNGYDSSGFMEFDRRDGSLPRTGNINMQDISGTKHDINNAGEVNAQTVDSASRITAGEYVQLNGLAVEGSGCSANGLLGRNASGEILSCKNLSWGAVGGSKFKQYSSGSCQGYGDWNGRTCAIADSTWATCSLAGASAVGDNESGLIYRDAAGNWFLYAVRASWAGIFYWQCQK